MQRTISRYVLLEQVGCTGLATVYRAQDPAQHREVALKVLRPYVCADEALMERFSREMERIVKLDHPNIVPVYGVEREDDAHWVAMQYVSWPTLRQWLQQPIPAAQAMVILRQVAEAVEAAHLQGIGHGDIKPGNIFLDLETGQVVLSDFGVALLGEGAPLGIRTALNIPLPTYAAPELGQGSYPTSISDVYSLGVLVYDMLTGMVPFSGLDRASVRARQLTSSPPLPSLVNPDVPTQLDAIILKALAPHPERRYKTPREFVEALVAAAPVPEAGVMPFKRVEKVEPQPAFPGLEAPEATPRVDDSRPIICTVCGHSNPAGSVWCIECWGVLSRVAATAGQRVYSPEERAQRRKKASRIRWALVSAALAVLVVYTAFQLLDITPPLPTPSSTLTADSGPGEWAMIGRNFGGPAPVLGESAAIDGQVKWTFKTSEPIVSTPAVKEGRVYLTTLDTRVVALDAATGAPIWEHKTVAPVDSSPTVAGGMVFYGARDRRVVALDADTGEERWTFVTEGNPTIGSPLVKDGVVYVGSGDGNIYALDALTGEKRWAHPTRDWIINTAALAGDKLVVASLDGIVTIYDTDTGKRRFSSRRVQQEIVASPIIAEDTIYAIYRNGILMSLNLNEEEALFAQRFYTLKLQLYVWGFTDDPGLPKGVNWHLRIGGSVVNTPAADEEKLYIPTQDGKLYAVDRLTGKRLWTFKSGAFDFSTPTLVENVALVGDNRGRLHAVDIDSGKEQWVLQIAGGILSTPVLADGTLYLASKDGTLYAVE
ncbi:MAG: PQQ-binding-like beta-propeller repeat protein [Chloroflexi bacterium]|nr:PQQ-binding-like beta-propeller repeat protein [Chloroflexota bacterium]